MSAVEPIDPIREAKIFLASRIAEEAELQGFPLADIERKMLYYSDSGWTLEDISTVNDAIARQLDRKEYEKRMASLIRNLRARLRAAGDEEYENWIRAIRVLKQTQEEKKETHYILALIAAAQPKGEVSRLVITALVVIAVLILAVFLASQKY